MRGDPTGDLSAAPKNTNSPIDYLTVQERAQMLTKLRSETAAQTMQDKNDIMRAVDGEFTKGQPPASYSDLSNIPQVKGALNRVAQNDPKFYETLDTIVARMAKKDVTTNSPNFYDAIQTSLDTSESWTRQASIEYLAKSLGSTNAGYSINQKDFNDAKPAIDLDRNLKSAISKDLSDYAAANGNIDGQGQVRAVQRYHQIMQAWQANTQSDKPLPIPDFLKRMSVDENGNKGDLAPNPPSRVQQIQNAAAAKTQAQPNVPIFQSADDPELAKLPKGALFKDAKGNMWTKN